MLAALALLTAEGLVLGPWARAPSIITRSPPPALSSVPSLREQSALRPAPVRLALWLVRHQRILRRG